MLARHPLLTGLTSGVLLGLASLPTPLGVISLVALVPLLALITTGCAGPRPTVTVRQGAAAGWIAGVAYFGIGFGWVPLASPSGGLALPAFYLLALPALALLVALFAAGIAWLACRGAPRLALLAAPGFWIALEYARSQDWLLNVPWLQLGYALTDRPLLIQSASLVGLYGLSFWVVAVNASLVALPRMSGATRLALGLALALPLLPGAAWITPELGDARALRVAAVQPDVLESDRHDPRAFHPNLGRLLELTHDTLSQGSADIVVWPESAYERPLPPGGDAFLYAIANRVGTPLLTGVWQHGGDGPTHWRNAAVLVDHAQMRTVAEKVHPVLVYERAPRGPLARTLARVGLWPGRFEPGDVHDPFSVEANGGPVSIGVLVCIDAGYSELARRYRAQGARLLVAISNEAGTGPWSARVHARVARLRAVEMRSPVVRVANTGPTQWIDARGRVSKTLGAGRTSGIADVALAGPPPLFVRLGDASVVAAAGGISIVGAGLPALRRSRITRPETKEKTR